MERTRHFIYVNFLALLFAVALSACSNTVATTNQDAGTPPTTPDTSTQPNPNPTQPDPNNPTPPADLTPTTPTTPSNPTTPTNPNNPTPTPTNPTPTPAPTNPTPTNPTPPSTAGTTSPYTIPAAASGKTFWVAQTSGASDSNAGTQTSPWRTIGKAINVARAGDVVVIRQGTYREFLNFTNYSASGTDANRRITYVAYPGEDAVVSGADIVTDWRQEGNLWWTPWTMSLPVGSISANYAFAGRREQVMQDDGFLKQVKNKTDLVAGSFWVEGTDSAPTKIYLRTKDDSSPLSHKIELTKRSMLLDSWDGIGWIRLIGLKFRYASNAYQQVALDLSGNNWLVEYLTIERTNSVGVAFNGSNNTARFVASVDNGQMGWSGSCTTCLIEDSSSLRNNWKIYDPNWESGGGKFVRSSYTTLRRFKSVDNYGPGLWFDGYNTNNTVDSCYFSNNLISGFQVEYLSNNNIFKNNVVNGTRRLASVQGVTGDGIRLTVSSGNILTHNTFTNNQGTAVSMVYESRGYSLNAYPTNNQVINNLFSNNYYGIGFLYALSPNDTVTNKLNGNLYWRASGVGKALFYWSTNPNSNPWEGDSLSTWQGYTGRDQNSAVGNPDLQSDGWHIGTASKAAALGVTPPIAVATDMENDPRPSSKADAGADQRK